MTIAHLLELPRLDRLASEPPPRCSQLHAYRPSTFVPFSKACGPSIDSHVLARWVCQRQVDRESDRKVFPLVHDMRKLPSGLISLQVLRIADAIAALLPAFSRARGVVHDDVLVHEVLSGVHIERHFPPVALSPLHQALAQICPAARRCVLSDDRKSLTILGLVVDFEGHTYCLLQA